MFDVLFYYYRALAAVRLGYGGRGGVMRKAIQDVFL